MLNIHRNQDIRGILMMTPCLLGAYLLLGENEVNLKDSLAYTLLYLACFNILRELVRQDAERVRPLNFRAIIISQRIAEDIASGQIPAA